MDEEIRGLERRWLESGEESDRFAWLCARLRSEGPPESDYDLESFMAEARGVYDDDEDLRVECRVGYVTDEPDPLLRLRKFSDHSGWWPAPDLSDALGKVLDVKRMGILYPHGEHDTQGVQAGFEALFLTGVAFANYQEHSTATTRGRSSSPFEGPLDDWETSDSLAVGATLGPLVGFLAVNVRDSL